MRHAAASPVGHDGTTRDSERRLTPAGRQRALHAAGFLGRMGWAPDQVVASPLPRALETARIVAALVSPDIVVEPLDIFQPGAVPDEVLPWLRSANAGRILAVGHLPDCADLIAGFIGSKIEIGLDFDTAATAMISFDGLPAAGRGHLMWLMPGALVERLNLP
jgi:phosphohistidine phosphatase SixA